MHGLRGRLRAHDLGAQGLQQGLQGAAGAAESCLFLVHILCLLLLRFFANDNLVRVTNALALVRLRRTECADLSGHLTNPLLVAARDDLDDRQTEGAGELVVALVVAGPWMLTVIMNFTTQLMRQIPSLIS